VFAYLRKNSKELWNEANQKAGVIPWSWSHFLVDEKGKVIKFCPSFRNAPADLRPIIMKA